MAAETEHMAGVDGSERGAGDAREISGSTVSLVVRYVRQTCGEAGVTRLLRLSGETRPLKALEDVRTWSTYDQKLALFRAAAQVTGDPDVAQAIGRAAVNAGLEDRTAVTGMLQLLGSPQQVFKGIARAVPKFSTVAEMQCLRVRRGSASARYRLRDGRPPDRSDCAYTGGLLSATPVLFGLPHAEVVHDQCRVDGADWCVFEVSWEHVGRWRRTVRRASRRATAPGVDGRLEALQDAVTTLVSAADVEDVLVNVADQAQTAVAAQRYLLTVRVRGETQPRVYADGFTPDEARTLADALLEDRPLPASLSAIVAPVRSARRDSGRLAAFVSRGHEFLDDDATLLASYARLAATALDAAEDRRAAQERQLTAEVLLGLAGRLLEAPNRYAVTDALSQAAVDVAGARRSTVWLWDDSEAALRLAGASTGYDDACLTFLGGVLIRAADSQVLQEMLAGDRSPRFLDESSIGSFVSELTRAVGTGAIMVVPLAGGGMLHGVLLAAWPQGGLVAGDPAVLGRLAGIADHGTAALQRTALVEQVQWQANHDPLTGLANRRLFTDRLGQRLASGDEVAVLFLDLDRFKPVNDTLGHARGDDLLRVVGERLQDAVRTDDLVSRLGGDEFTVLLSSTHGEREVREVAERIVASLDEPVLLGGTAVVPRASVGGVLIAPGDANVAEVLRVADHAMYDAKALGGGRLVLHSLGEEAAVQGSPLVSREAELRTAVTTGLGIVVHWQPQVDLDTGRLVGAEALVRWDHPRDGMLAPAEFLPLAARTGLGARLDALVLRTACAQGAFWWRTGMPLRIAVNTAPQSLCEPGFAQGVRVALRESGLPAGALELEVTSAGDLPRTAEVLQVMTDLRELGVHMAHDDVGSGYAALSWASALPVGRLKVDRSFVNELRSAGPGAAVVEAVLGLADRLETEALASGVEDEGTADLLRALGCREAQGFHYARPLPADELEVYARERGVVSPLAAFTA